MVNSFARKSGMKLATTWLLGVGKHSARHKAAISKKLEINDIDTIDDVTRADPMSRSFFR